MNNLAQKAAFGISLDDIEVIDSHNHLGKWNAFYVPQGGTIEQMLARAARLGIDKLCITAHSSIGPDYRYGNDMVYDAITRYPDKVIGYVTVNPNYPEDMENELKRCSAKKGFRAIKYHPSCHGQAPDCKSYAPAYEEAARRDCPVLIHTWGWSDVMAIDRAASSFPETKIIIAHTGGDQKAMEVALDIINRHDNVYGDLALSTPLQGNVEWLVREVGAKKILFGTDMPFFDPSPCLARVAMADIKAEEQKDIFAGNVIRLMHLEQFQK
jgi:Predicted metal-dependent hydrolase of the TIM-barrel fold